MGRQGSRPGVLTQENCRKVTRSVEDAEIKTNVLKQNSALLEVRGGHGEEEQRREILEVDFRWDFPPHPTPSPTTLAPSHSWLYSSMHSHIP